MTNEKTHPGWGRFDTFIFDVDGTLLDTLPDLVKLTNTALHDFGYPTHTEHAIRGFVGGGAYMLIRQAVPQSATEEEVLAATKHWRELYATVGIDLTKPYPHIIETLKELKRRGVSLGVLSNKFDAGVHQVIDRYMPNLFDAIHGESEDFPRKPDPAGLLRTMEEIGANPQHTVYVGDSSADVGAAHNAGVFALGVRWGYHEGDPIEKTGADAIVDDAREFLNFSRL